MLCQTLSRKYHRRSIIFTCFAAVSASGLLISCFGGFRPWILILVLLPATICASCVRTPGTNLMLEQQRGDTGSAAALMSCFGVFMGSIGMTIISLNWSDTILVLGAMNVLMGLMAGALWLRISQKPYVMQVPERYIASTSTSTTTA